MKSEKLTQQNSLNCNTELVEFLSEEIADLTEILAEEPMSNKSKEKLVNRLMILSEKRDGLRGMESEK